MVAISYQRDDSLHTCTITRHKISLPLSKDDSEFHR